MSDSNCNEQEEEPQTILVIFKVKAECRQDFFNFIKNEDLGIKFTKSQDGFVSVEGRFSVDDEETVVLWAKWKNKECHEEYLRKKTEQGFADKYKEIMAGPPVFMHLSKDKFC